MEKDDDYNFLVILHLKSEQYMQTVPQTVGDESVALKTRVSVQQVDLGSICLSVPIYIYFIAKRCQ